MKKLISILAAVAMIAIAGCGGSGSSPESAIQVAMNDQPAATSVAKDAEVVPGELIVKFNSSITSSDATSVHKSVGKSVGLPPAEVIQHFDSVNVSHIKVPAGMTDADAAQAYRNSGMVDVVEPNTIVHIESIPNDALYKANEWGLPMISAPAAWDKTTGSSNVIIGVIDTGIQADHPDLKANWSGYWYNAITPTSTTPIDDNGHGTHVAGIIGAQGNNAAGVTGVNWNSKIAACKFINAAGSGSTAAAISCVNYFNGLKAKGVNIVAVNDSWGSTVFSQILSDAIAAEPRIIHVAAPGNSALDNDTTPNYPAALKLPNVISVAATTFYDAIASYSDYGRRSVLIGAPGEAIMSTIPTSAYGVKSGTSMAAPHVAGAIGLIYAAKPSMTSTGARNLIASSGDTTVAMTNKSITGKRLNVDSAIACSNKPMFSLVKVPSTLSGGTAATFTMLSVNCDAPEGPITVTSSAQNKTYTVANTDGLATFTYTPSSSNETLKFSSAAGSETFSIGTPSITSLLPTNLSVGQLVSQQVLAGGGTQPYKFSATSLPGGLSISATGLISGTITTAGTFSAVVTVTDAKGVVATRTGSMVVNTAAKLVTASLPTGTVGIAYNQTLSASGGTAPLTWSSTTAVSGLNLSIAGVLSGTPTTGTTAAYNVTIKDANGVVTTSSIPLTIVSAPKLVTAFPTLECGMIINTQLQIQGGTAPYTFVGNMMPAGIGVSSSGVVSGSPLIPGTTIASITITDAKGVKTAIPLTITVASAPSVTNTSMPAAKVNTPYSLQFNVTGGTPGYTWRSISSISGLSMDKTGLLTGTPKIALLYNFMAEVTDANGVKSTRSILFTVSK